MELFFAVLGILLIVVFICGLLTELDDQSHQKAERQAADTKKDKALSSAGIRVIRWQVKAMPDLEAIKAAFADATT